MWNVERGGSGREKRREAGMMQIKMCQLEVSDQ
jgi:hypothetical protein